LILTGAKQVEWRSWETSYRGPLGIHAGRTLWAGENQAEPDYQRLLATYEAAHRASDPRAARGALLGCVELVGVQEPQEVGWNFGWQLRRPQILPRPLICSGQRGLWVLPPDVAGALDNALLVDRE